jgi:hypothetical protein
LSRPPQLTGLLTLLLLLRNSSPRLAPWPSTAALWPTSLSAMATLCWSARWRLILYGIINIQESLIHLFFMYVCPDLRRQRVEGWIDRNSGGGSGLGSREGGGSRARGKGVLRPVDIVSIELIEMMKNLPLKRQRYCWKIERGHHLVLAASSPFLQDCAL